MAYNVNHYLRVGDAKTIHDAVQGQVDDLKSALHDFERGVQYIPSTIVLGYLDANGVIQGSTYRATFNEYVQLNYPCYLAVQSGYAITYCTYNSNNTMLTRTNYNGPASVYIPTGTRFRCTVRQSTEQTITDLDAISKTCQITPGFGYALSPGVNETVMPSNYTNILTNANNAPTGRTFLIMSTITSQHISNLPEYGSIAVLATISAFVNSDHGRLQLFVNKNGGFWYRCESGTGSTYNYTAWVKVATQTDIQAVRTEIKTAKYDFLRCFHKFCGIGDSLMAGFTSIDGTTVSSADARAAGNNWFQYLMTRLNREGTNLAVGSSTLHNWRYGSDGETHTTNLDDADIEGVDCYFVGLGVNDMTRGTTTHPIGTAADIEEDYTDNADSVYGNLDFILHKLASFNQYAKVFVFTIPWYGEHDPTNINAAIRAVCALNNNAFCIDLAQDSDIASDTFVTGGYTGGHFTPLIYNYLGTKIENAVNEYIFDHYSDLKWVPYEH